MAEAPPDGLKVAELDDLPEGRVMSVTAGTRSLALVHFDGQYAAMDNHRPHQGGPLGEGAIEKGVDGEWPVWQTHLVNPAFAGFARSCGGDGDLVTEAGQLDAAIEKALGIEGPALVEVKADIKLV